MSSTEMVVREAGALAERSVDEVLAQVQKIQQLMAKGMKKDEHYGTIGGTQKPTLLKPGAEKLCFMFRLDPEYPDDKLHERWEEGGHYTVTATCVLYHIDSGVRIASGLGLCSTREEKYAYRQAERHCPDCGEPTVVRSVKKEAYFCIRDKGGCGHRFAFGTDKAEQIDGQEVGQKPNPRLPDSYNTVLKMACKRALIAAVLNGTAASDIFTQDLDDSDEQPPPAPAASNAAGAASTGGQAAEPLEGPSSGGGAHPPRSGPDLLMTFGAHKDTRVGDLPVEYLEWLAGEVPFEGSTDGPPAFVPEDEYSGQLVEAAQGVLERVRRAQAIENFSAVYANLAENFPEKLPPGHDDWGAYLRWYIEGKYKIDPGAWRAELSTEQIRELTVYLADYEIPL